MTIVLSCLVWMTRSRQMLCHQQQIIFCVDVLSHRKPTTLSPRSCPHFCGLTLRWGRVFLKTPWTSIIMQMILCCTSISSTFNWTHFFCFLFFSLMCLALSVASNEDLQAEALEKIWLNRMTRSNRKRMKISETNEKICFFRLADYSSVFFNQCVPWEMIQFNHHCQDISSVST